MPKTPFFVTGLPRSGTAWMATFLSGCPGVTCSHEALRHLERIEDLPAALPEAPFSGTADSALPLFLDEVEAMFPNAPWILLDRAETASREAISRFLGGEPAPGLYEAVRAPLARIREKALVIPFEELTNEFRLCASLQRIGLRHPLYSDSPSWPKIRPWWRHMKDLHVSVRREAYADLKLDTPMARRVQALVQEGAPLWPG